MTEFEKMRREEFYDFTSGESPPFHCDHGHGIKLGENVFINYNGTMLDTRKQRYKVEAEAAFNGHIFVPDDLEKIML